MVEAVPGIYYYEAEKECEEGSDLSLIDQELKNKVLSLNLPIFTTDKYREFINLLGEKVNRYIEW